MITLGSQVLDIASGFTGLVTSRRDQLSGSVQYCVQPKGDGKTMPEAYTIDEMFLKVTGTGDSLNVIAPPPILAKLGEQVEDRVSGAKGIVIERYTYVNGCVTLIVQPKISEKGVFPDTLAFDHARLKVIGCGVSTEVTPDKPEKERTGGPSMKAPRF